MMPEAAISRDGKAEETQEQTGGEVCPLRVCPSCGGRNDPDAVFCANPACHKALGEFRYVLEEMRAQSRWHETLAERITAFIGRPQFLAVHAAWFASWILLNTGLVMAVWKFDRYPFSLL